MDASPAAAQSSVAFTVNGRAIESMADANRSLLDILRNDLNLRSSHFGCGSGECGACMVLLEGVAVPACNTPLWSVANKCVVTSEGLGTPEKPHPVQSAFIAEQAAQCGYCTSGMMIAAASLLQRLPHPTDVEIREGMARNLCRCGTHPRVMRAIERAAGAETKS
jgi:nicotinate dehydrogenase subunit A